LAGCPVFVLILRDDVVVLGVDVLLVPVSLGTERWRKGRNWGWGSYCPFRFLDPLLTMQQFYLVLITV